MKKLLTVILLVAPLFLSGCFEKWNPKTPVESIVYEYYVYADIYNGDNIVQQNVGMSLHVNNADVDSKVNIKLNPYSISAYSFGVDNIPVTGEIENVRIDYDENASFWYNNNNYDNKKLRISAWIRDRRFTRFSPNPPPPEYYDIDMIIEFNRGEDNLPEDNIKFVLKYRD